MCVPNAPKACTTQSSVPRCVLDSRTILLNDHQTDLLKQGLGYKLHTAFAID